MNAQNWNDEEEEEKDELNGEQANNEPAVGEDEIVEEKLSKKALLKSIVKDKKVVKKPQRNSRRSLKFWENIHNIFPVSESHNMNKRK